MSLTKRIDEARQAFANRDKSAAARAHQPGHIAQAAEEHSGVSSQYLGEMVYGGLDGIVTTFAVVNGVAGAQLGAQVVIILGPVGFVTSFGAHAVAVNLPTYAAQVGAGTFTIGVLIAVYDFAELIAKPLFGYLTVKRGQMLTL